MNLAETSHTADELPFTPAIHMNEVWDAFTLLCLLEDRLQLSSVLVLPHKGLQEHRFDAAMQERNERIQLAGLPDVRHSCRKCTRTYDNREVDLEAGIGTLYFLLR